MKSDRGRRVLEHHDGVRSIEILHYDVKHTPAKFDGDTICLRFSEKPWTSPLSIYITWEEALSIASGLLMASIKDRLHRESKEEKEVKA